MNRAEALNRATTWVSAASRDAERIGKALWKILSMSPADDAFWPAGCLCAVCAEGGLHVLHASRTLSRIRIRGRRFYAAEEGTFPMPQALAADLKMAVTDLRAAGADVILVVPASWVITRRAELPPAVSGHLSSVVGYELDRLTPLASDEAHYDYGLIGQQPEAVRIAVAAARADRIDPYLEAVRERGIEVRKVVTDLDALGSLCRFVHRTDSCVLLEPSAGGYQGGLLENGVLSLTFSGRFASKDPHERARQLSRELGEILERNLPGQDPPWVIVTATAQTEAVRDLAGHLGRPARILGPEQARQHVQDAPEGFSLTALGGLLATIAPGVSGMNLLAHGAREEKKSPRALTAILVACLAVTGFFLLVSPLALEERRIEEIDRQIELHRDEVRKADAVKREGEAIDADIASISRFKAERPVALEILRELTALLPKNAWLSRARITDSTVDIEGYAAAATDILPLLEASNYFKKAEFASSTLRDTRLNAERFTIRMELEGHGQHGLESSKKK